ncbi:transglutaminase domain-containing protein [Cohnella sp. JJ-181]|uniref:transglutaminase domain-containing protein n=1 Tax=Cohnella rhizoplanae TaxID=2974897 RepID=UPI0022FF8E98|nr:transglutaminase domain-containing protein [Cohnella sp. JJ-181]CAI6035350.1 hypothetical protein COHCIP112018_00871 [Cohnella sp. JJ-181]
MTASKRKLSAFTGFLLSSALLLASACWPYRDTAVAAVSAGETATLQSALKQKLGARSESFSLVLKGKLATAEVSKAFDVVFAADDYLKYAIRSYRYAVSTDGKTSTLSVTMKYWETAAQTAYVNARSKQILASIVTKNMNAHQKVKAIHDWVLLHVAYDRSLVRHSAYDALKNGLTVCQGYASLTYRLLTDAGIPARIVEGTVSTGAHAWNLVKLDGVWYQLDTTFDDPVPDVKGRTTYGYYLVTDAALKKDHVWKSGYPQAVTSYKNTLASLAAKDKSRTAFYKDLREDMGLDYLDPSRSVSTVKEIAAQLRSAAAAGQTSAKMRYTSESKPDLDALLKLMPELSSVSYQMETMAGGDPGDSMLTVTFKLRQ